jgi:hypothetical protein
MAMIDGAAFQSAGQELSRLESLLNTIINIDDKIRNAWWKRSGRRILTLLRVIYFERGGVIQVLDRIIAGEPVDRRWLARPNLAGREPEVRAAIRELAELCAVGNIRLDLDVIETVDRLLLDKSQARRLVLELAEVNDAQKLDADEIEIARQLRAKLMEINALIERAEAVIRPQVL